MRKFKSLFLFFLSIFFTTSCLETNVKSDGKFSISLFTVDEVTGNLTILTQTALPEKFTLQLKACLRDRKRAESSLPYTTYRIANTEKALEKAELEEKKPKTNPEQEIETNHSNSASSKPASSKEANQSAAARTTNLSKKQPVITVTADGTGCVNWTEEYDYSYTPRSRWIVLDRYFQGESASWPGMVHLPLAVNPWLKFPQENQHKDIQVADYRAEYHKHDSTLKKDIEKNGLAFLEAEKTKKVNIVIPTIDLNVTDGGSNQINRILKGNIKAELKYSIIGVSGNDLQNHPIHAGNFRIEPKLLITMKNKASINKYFRMKMDEEDKDKDNSQKIRTRFQDNQLVGEPFEWKIPFEAYNKEISLYIKVIPIGNTSKRINSFEGIYSIASSLDKILDSHQELELNASLDVKHYNKIRKAAQSKENEKNVPLTEKNDAKKKSEQDQCLEKPNHQNIWNQCILSTLDKNEDGVRRAGWSVERMFLRFNGVKKEDWLTRKIKTIVETKITDPLARAAVNDTRINIAITDLSSGKKKNIEGKTDESGNISFTIETKQYWYKRQRYFLKLIEFSNEKDDLSVKRIVSINPWDYGFTHGFDQADEEIRTTCLFANQAKTQSGKQSDERKEEQKNIKHLLSKETSEITLKGESKSRSDELLKTIHKIFCHNKNLYPPTDGNPVSSNSWIDIFINFKKIFIETLVPDDETLATDNKEPVINEEDKRANNFYKKFTSSKAVPPPQSYIHLFRSINTYPTYLIDSSLNRNFYYNMRFKVSPKIVRYDDIPRGQQNKGPIRDGIYIFQMAALKNDQERFDGNFSMVRGDKRNHTWDSSAQDGRGGSSTLYNCDTGIIDDGKGSAKCIKKSDFISPPENIPILIRDGMVKTDIDFRIVAETLLFANSKNILVFRVIPANPKDIICNDGTQNCGVHDNPHSPNFDWKATVKNIRNSPYSAREFYDLFINTYQTPMIPSSWTNWNIANELIAAQSNQAGNDSEKNPEGFFDRLSTIYKEVKDREIIEEYKISISEMITNSKRNNESGNTVLSYKDAVSYETNSTQYQNLLLADTNVLQLLRANIQEIEKGLIEKFGESKATAIKTILNSLTNIPNCENVASSSTSYSQPNCSKQSPITMNDLQEIANKTTPTSRDQKSTQTTLQFNPNKGTSECVNLKQENKITGITEGIKPSSSTSTFCSESEDKNLFNNHIEYFASTNALCTVGMDSPLSKSCGSDKSKIGETFLKNVNQHIRTINETRVAIQLNETILDKILPGETETKLIHKSLKTSHDLYLKLSQKIMELPELTELTNESLQRIINSGIEVSNFDISAGNLDKETISFMHGLCGFWFENFYTKQYVNKELLLDGFRKFIKQTFYYKLRGVISFSSNEVGTKMQKTLNEDLEEIHGLYKSYLQDLRKEGLLQNEKGFMREIINLHEWADGRETKQSTEVQRRLEKNFTELSTKNITTTSVRNVLSSPNRKTKTVTQKQLAFGLQKYFNQMQMDKPTFGEPEKDIHPVRKCLLNPSHFFGFENKIVVGSVDQVKKHDYKNGEMLSLRASQDFLMNTQRDQGANQTSQTEIGSTLNLLTIPLLAVGSALAATKITGSLLLPIAATQFATQAGRGASLFAAALAGSSIASLTGLMGRTGYSYSSYEGTGKRRLISYRVDKGVELNMEHTPLEIQLNKYRHCIVIRPRFSAFESESIKYNRIWVEKNKMVQAIYKDIGMFLCSNEQESNASITEDYYYIYPKYSADAINNAITLDPNNYRNRPFIINLRGKNERDKFISDISCYITNNENQLKEGLECRSGEGNYEYLLDKKIEFTSQLRKGFETPRMFHFTGHSPGIYSVEGKKTPEPEEKPESNLMESWVRFFSSIQLADVDILNFVRN